VCLLSEDNGRYASADGTDGRLYLNRNSVSQWETFNIENQPNGYVAIKALRNNMYLNVTDMGYLEPTEAKVYDSCLFTLEIPNGGNFH